MSDEDRYSQYRLNAAEAERQSKNAKNDTDRASWLRLVNDWLSLLPKRSKLTASESFDEALKNSDTHQDRSEESH
jgi:hypothetical protein